jgi:hypothetical protein
MEADAWRSMLHGLISLAKNPRFHLLTLKMANRRRQVVLLPGFNICCDRSIIHRSDSYKTHPLGCCPSHCASICCGRGKWANRNFRSPYQWSKRQTHRRQAGSDTVAEPVGSERLHRSKNQFRWSSHLRSEKSVARNSDSLRTHGWLLGRVSSKRPFGVFGSGDTPNRHLQGRLVSAEPTKDRLAVPCQARRGLSIRFAPQFVGEAYSL